MEKLNFRYSFWFCALGSHVNRCCELGGHKKHIVQWWLQDPGTGKGGSADASVPDDGYGWV